MLKGILTSFICALAVLLCVGLIDGRVSAQTDTTQDEWVTLIGRTEVAKRLYEFSQGLFGQGISLTNSGTTLTLEDGTAASTCIGSLTATGATAKVTSTTCAESGDYVFLTRTSDPSTNAECWVSSISNGVSFTTDCGTAGDTGTFNWFIVKGQ